MSSRGEEAGGEERRKKAPEQLHEIHRHQRCSRETTMKNHPAGAVVGGSGREEEVDDDDDDSGGLECDEERLSEELYTPKAADLVRISGFHGGTTPSSSGQQQQQRDDIRGGRRRDASSRAQMKPDNIGASFPHLTTATTTTASLSPSDAGYAQLMPLMLHVIHRLR